MYLSREAISAAAKVELPNQEQIFTFTEHDKKIWQKAFDWYNEFMNHDRPPKTMNCKPCFSQVYVALKKAKEFLPREDII